MMEGLKPEEEWHGIYFFARTLSVGMTIGCGSIFALSDGVELGFHRRMGGSEGNFSERALRRRGEESALQLSLAYGEL